MDQDCAINQTKSTIRSKTQKRKKKKNKKKKKKNLDTVKELSVLVFSFNGVHCGIKYLIPASKFEDYSCSKSQMKKKGLIN